jgi:S-DNA-T family DNA segregation ATPase FtsK/SpoIIIE
MGDMLYAPVGSGKPTRIQGAFVSDEEREEVIQFIKEGAGEVSANNEILAAMEQSAAEKTAAEGSKGAKDEGTSASGYDEMLPQAVEAVLEAGSCSVSMLQRRVKLGYSRAARIVDQMEELGVVGPYEGAKPRSVVIDREGWQALQVRLGLASDSDMALAAQMSEDAPTYDSED